MGDLRKLVVGIRMSDDNAQMVPPPRRQARGIISILFEHEQATQQVSMNRQSWGREFQENGTGTGHL
ncbi:hypothetical protein NC653_022485 [Populus alba x Populus x berolinensis]|uniref:Uncharacterized protein n=1 Tax=Populus alba x Populus x berolinensis TaxID=444605 RepID=A0AAD6MEV9_9ROSI|nr:hypothetical protein NC653_022481 [Populus alba x Populus x berolinensis]KAJ6984242.1 hypothetical protein NC653_022485 [Populus alba x Populus x berolinensis]